jgi:nucleoporin GLE1
MIINRDKEFRARLDQTTEEQQKEHEEALRQAHSHHESVRERARLALAVHEKQELEKQREAEAAERKEHDDIEKRLAEQKQKELLEEARRLREKEEQKLRDEKALHEEEARLQEAKEKREAEAETAKRRMAASQTSTTTQPVVPTPTASNPFTKPSPLNAQTPVPQPSQTTASAPIPQSTQLPSAPVTNRTAPNSSIAHRDAVHKQYLDLHKHLKQMRKSMRQLSRENGSPIKDMDTQRREITKFFGQFANATGNQEVAKTNQKKRIEIVAVLRTAFHAPGPKLDARRYILNSRSDFDSLPAEECHVSGKYLYLVNFCVKAAVQQLTGAAIATYNSAEPIGITLALIFGDNALRWRGESFIDILLAKLHKRCPILFGIYGSEKTERGRERLGWITDSSEKSGYIPDQAHYDEMAGYAMGWAALTLRNFKKAKSATNACPPWLYWRTIAYLVETPPAEATATHFVVLKGMLEHYGDKFIENYGQAATVAMRKAIVEFPRTHAGQAKGNMVQGLQLLREVFQNKWQIIL